MTTDSVSTPRRVFVDESGNKDVDVPKPGATNFYVACAVVVPEPRVSEFTSLTELIATRHFGGSQIKSSNVGDDAKRRANILTDVIALPAIYYVLATDKQRVNRGSGLRFGKSFYKFVMRMAYAEVLKSFSHVHMTVDTHGSDAFQQSVIEYMKSRFSDELFARHEYAFGKSKDVRGCQVADFIAGSVRHAEEQRAAQGAYPDFMESLSAKLTYYGPWPRQAFPFHLEHSTGDADRDFSRPLVTLVHRRALAFVAANQHAVDHDLRARVICVRILLLAYTGPNPRAYIRGDLIRVRIAQELADHVHTQRAFMNRIIAPLRDRGLIIVASDKGYKMPVSVSEVLSFVHGTCTKVMPMVRRLHRVRDALREATNGVVDVYERPELAFLKALGLT